MSILRTGLAVLLAIAVGGASASDQPLFRFGGYDYAEGDLPANLQRSLYEARAEQFRKLSEVIDASVLHFHLEEEARRSGKTLEEVTQARLAVTPPTQQEVEAFYRQNRQRIPAPLAQVRGDIVRFLEGKRRDARKAEIVAGLKASGDFKAFVTAPQPPYYEIATEGFPSKGNPYAKVTVVEFADYQCPHCKQASGALKSLMQTYGDRVRLVFMDFPINRSGISRKVAEGAVCADRQGKFWEYHDEAFARQAGLSATSPAAIAKALGLDEAAFAACYGDPDTAAKVDRALAEARRLGLDSTPSLFVNGRPVQVHDFEDSLRDAIERALRASKS